MQFFMLGMASGGQGEDSSLQRDWEGLRILGEWVAGPAGLALGLKEGEAWGKKLVMEVATRNAKMVAAWQVSSLCLLLTRLWLMGSWLSVGVRILPWRYQYG
jgi:hypothetical protein